MVDITKLHKDRNRQAGADTEFTLLPEPEPRELWCPIISVDDHALEPPTLFERLPARYRDRGPQHEVIDGLPYWIIDGERFGVKGQNGASGRPITEWRYDAVPYEHMRRGVWDPQARLDDMALNGVWGSLNFPSMIWGFAGTTFAKMQDPDLGLACLRAYNDWMLETWCAADPDRLIPCQVTWLADPVVAAREIERNAERGFRAVSLSENPENLGFPSIYSDHWDPVLRACEETGTVINLHIGSSGSITQPSSDSAYSVVIALFPLNGMQTVVDWLFAKIPIRFPKLQIVLSEAGVSWAPMIIQQLEHVYSRRQATTDWEDADGHPVEVLRRNFWFASLKDPVAFRLLDVIGDRIMVESDYPHSDSTWPDTQERLKRELGHLDGDTIRTIAYANAAELYRTPPPPDDWLQRSVVGQAASHATTG